MLGLKVCAYFVFLMCVCDFLQACTCGGLRKTLGNLFFYLLSSVIGDQIQVVSSVFDYPYAEPSS